MCDAVDRLIGAISQSFTVTLACKDSGGSVINTATASSVTCYANERTFLSGNLFTEINNNNSSQTFTAKADAAWNTTLNQVNFGLRPLPIFVFKCNRENGGRFFRINLSHREILTPFLRIL